MEDNMIKSTLTAATLGLALIATPAMADAGETVSIEYRDLNLSSPEGQKRLDRRINQAAAKICGLRESRSGTRLSSRKSKECYEKARQSAAKQVAVMVTNEQRGG